MSTFGAQVSPSRAFAVITMFVHDLNGTHMQISVLIVPELAAPIGNSVRAHLHAIPHLQKLPLAHPVTGDENFHISVLIGADYYWDFVQDHVVRGSVQAGLSSIRPTLSTTASHESQSTHSYLSLCQSIFMWGCAPLKFRIHQ